MDYSSKNEGADDVRLPEEVANALREDIWREPPGRCPSPKTINDYADLSLPWWRSVLVTRHVRKCPACTVMAARLAAANMPIRKRLQAPHRHAGQWGLALAYSLALLFIGTRLPQLGFPLIQGGHGDQTNQTGATDPGAPTINPKGGQPIPPGVSGDLKKTLLDLFDLEERGELIDAARVKQVENDLKVLDEISRLPQRHDDPRVFAWLYLGYQRLADNTKDPARAREYRVLEKKILVKLAGQLGLQPPAPGPAPDEQPDGRKGL